jgi:hypothetical protein
LDNSQLLLIGEGAPPCDDAKGGEQDDEAERFNVVVVTEDACDIVIEGACNKEEQAAANQSGIGRVEFDAKECDDKYDERAYYNAIIDDAEDVSRTDD